MQISEFQKSEDNPHKLQGNPHVECNALYKTGENVNCYLTAGQAIELARHLLQKAHLIVENDIEDAAVHMWSQGTTNEKMYVGLTTARKGPRRKQAKSK